MQQKQLILYLNSGGKCARFFHFVQKNGTNQLNAAIFICLNNLILTYEQRFNKLKC